MKTFLLISLAVLAGAQIVSAQGATDYYPLHVGYYWVQHTDTISGGYQPTTFRQDIEGTDLILGEEYYRSSNWFTTDDGSSESRWYTWVREDPTGIVLGAFGDTGIVDSATIYDPPLPSLPNEAVDSVGYTWEFDFPEAGGHYSLSVESITETVQVPAGIFNDCIKIKLVITDTSGDTTQMNHYYGAEGVGEVLNIGWNWWQENFEFELIEYYVSPNTIDEDGITEIPARFHLQQNYPNPFNPTTGIQYAVGSRQTQAVHGSRFIVHGPIPTTLKIYNILGQKVRTLVDEPKTSGNHVVIWDGKDDKGKEVTSGIYFYQLRAGDFTETKKMLLLK